ncbi:MAG: glycosyltransferase family 4 protein [Armatimonadetes bacterium]|nr:glycosyltransferase family 4 protein [Armatimonadota bacterium]
MKKFRVLHLIRPAAGGMKNHLLSLLSRLNPDLFEIVAACPDGPLAAEIAHAGFRAVALPLVGELSFRKDWETIRLLVKILREEKIAILHAHSAKAGFVGRLAARLARTPVIFLTAHNSIFYEDWPAWKKMILAAAERALSRVTDRIITVSEALRRELMQKEGINPDRIVTIYNGIGPAPGRPPRERRQVLRELGLPPLGQVVGTIARLAPQKGVGYFLKAAAMLVKDYQVNFLIVGGGPLRRQLESEAISLGLQNRVVFTGEREDVPAILPVFDIFVLPSLTEGFPLTILEALAAGRPVIATRVGGIPEAIVDNYTGLLVKPGDPAGLALAIAELLSDRERALALGRAGQACARDRFTVAQMVRRVEEEYIKALTAKGLFTERDGWNLPETGGVQVKK